MGLLGDLVKTVSDVVTSGRRGGTPSREAGRTGGRRPASTPAALPGESGPDATVEVDPHRIGPVRMSYSPQTAEVTASYGEPPRRSAGQAVPLVHPVLLVLPFPVRGAAIPSGCCP
jgi:hypothetical protein